MWSTRELIVAPAAPAGSGCRSVVRLSGDGLEPLLRTLFLPTAADFAAAGDPPRVVVAALSPVGLAREWGGVSVDILHWPGPGGPTGGPLAEVQLPASAPLAAALVAEACRHGARLARGGEFTLRAFLAGRLDLVQAEAVLAVVEATSPAELSAALDALAGGVGRQLEGVRQTLLDLAADVEAAIDFADEATPDAMPAADAAARAAIVHRLADAAALITRLADALAGRDRGAGGELPRVVLVGPPNIGKSSLFNRLVDREAALVADEAGTTRDWIAVRLDGPPSGPSCLLVDVAGTADAPPTRGGDVARMADARAREEIARAAVVVVCRDATSAAGREPHGPAARQGPRIDVITRCDRGGAAAADAGCIRTSSVSGEGISAVREAILREVAGLPAGGTPATVRLRAGLSAARDALAAALQESGGPAGGTRPGGDDAVVAALVRRAATAIGEVTGRDIGPELIDRIFSRHCIGK